MGAKRVICTILYVLFTLLFTALLICNVTGFINQFNIMPNDFFTTTINNNLINPTHTAFDALHIMDSTLLYSIICLLYMAITLFFWFLSVSMLVSVLRNTPTRGTSITAIVFSIVFFVCVDVVVMLLVFNGSTITEVLQNYYLIGSAVLWLLTLIAAIIALNIRAGVDKLDNTTEEEQPNGLSPALAREKRIQELLNEDIDPRV